jgi:hypothetical protein
MRESAPSLDHRLIVNELMVVVVVHLIWGAAVAWARYAAPSSLLVRLNWLQVLGQHSPYLPMFSPLVTCLFGLRPAGPPVGSIWRFHDITTLMLKCCLSL